MKYRREIDGLRALAVLPVILFHAGFEILGGGFVGVDVFFVISGYLITSIILTEKGAGTFSLVTFYERRARRILPALFLVLAVTAPFAWYWLLPADLMAYAKSLAAVPIFSSNILFWRESGYFDSAAELKPLLHTWSLAVEEQYYLLFPLFILVMWRFGRKWLVPSLILVAALSLIMAQRRAVVNPAFAFFLLPTRGWELLIGSFIAFHASKVQNRVEPDRVIANVAAAAGMSMLVFAVFVFDKRTPFPGIYALVPTVGTALLILFATPQTAIGRFLGSRMLVGVGLISYSAYLWHQPLLSLARHRSLDEPSAVVLLSLCVATLLLAYLTWRFVEQPFRNSEAIGRNKIIGFALGGSVVLIVAGFALYESGREGNRHLVKESPNFSCNGHIVDGGLCIFGNMDAKNVVVLVGDSHANHFSNALNDAIGKDFKIILIVCSSCYLGERVRFDQLAVHADELASARKSIQLLHQYKVHAVIRAQRWHGYGVQGESQIKAAIEDAVHFFGVKYDRMIIMGSTADVPIKCHIGKYFGKFRHDVCEENLESHELNREFMKVTGNMKVPANIRFLYPYPKVCKFEKCTVINGDTLYFADYNHLTKTGASLVAGDVKNLLDPS